MLVCTALALVAAAASWFLVERAWLGRKTPDFGLVLRALRLARYKLAVNTVEQCSLARGEDLGLSRLNFLRFIAVMVVVIFHFGLAVEPISAWPLLHGVLHGPTAVSFFFVLSGFVLTAAYAARFIEAEVSARSFWRARLA